MKVVIAGAGALGSAIGGTLACGGMEVALISANAAHVAAIGERGLTLVSPAGEQVVRAIARADYDGLAPGWADVVIVLVKSAETRAAIEAARPVIGAGSVVFSLQNGLGHEDVLACVIGPDQVLGGKTYAGGVMLAPGRVQASVAGKVTIIGEPAGGNSARAERIAEAFSGAGVPTKVSSNMRGTIWDKLLVNVATGALSALTRMTYGEMYARDDLRACALAAVDEAMAVARAQGVVLSIPDAATAWTMAAQGLPGNFRTSMLQSLEKGRCTEIDFINGAVAERGRALGIPVPVNALLSACIGGVERSRAFARIDCPHGERR